MQNLNHYLQKSLGLMPWKTIDLKEFFYTLLIFILENICWLLLVIVEKKLLKVKSIFRAKLIGNDLG